jgi:hypothetical protein
MIIKASKKNIKIVLFKNYVKNKQYINHYSNYSFK